MLDALYKISDTAIFFLLTIITVGISLIGVFLAKRYIGIDLRYKENAVIGATSALISVIYAVLIGIMALYLTSNNSYTSDAVLHEANAVADVFHGSIWLKEPIRSQIQGELKHYLNQVIHTEWPAMANNSVIDHGGDIYLYKINEILRNYTNPTATEEIAMREMLNKINILYDSRHRRINMSYAKLSPEIWVVVFIGAILILFVNYLFGMNFYLHVYVVITVALMVTSMIFLLVTLDRPFQGQFAIEPEPFQSLLTFIEANDRLPTAPS